jgi:ribosome-associated protein
MPAADGLVVTDSVVIPWAELTVRATRAGGPGGQHVNTSATRVEIVWNVDRSRALDPAQRTHVRARLASRLDSAGNVRVVAAEFRSQRQNRDAAETRLATLIARALFVPKRRRPTRPTASAKRARLDDKRRRSDKKKQRSSPSDHDA